MKLLKTWPAWIALLLLLDVTLNLLGYHGTLLTIHINTNIRATTQPAD